MQARIGRPGLAASRPQCCRRDVVVDVVHSLCHSHQHRRGCALQVYGALQRDRRIFAGLLAAASLALVALLTHVLRAAAPYARQLLFRCG